MSSAAETKRETYYIATADDNVSRSQWYTDMTPLTMKEGLEFKGYTSAAHDPIRAFMLAMACMNQWPTRLWEVQAHPHGLHPEYVERGRVVRCIPVSELEACWTGWTSREKIFLPPQLGIYLWKGTGFGQIDYCENDVCCALVFLPPGATEVPLPKDAKVIEDLFDLKKHTEPPLADVAAHGWFGRFVEGPRRADLERWVEQNMSNTVAALGEPKLRTLLRPLTCQAVAAAAAAP